MPQPNTKPPLVESNIYAKPPSKQYLFHLWLDPLSHLKQAITSLSDPFFNPSGTAVLHFGEKGLEISVNGTNKTIGLLQLRSASYQIKGFVCREEIIKVVDLNDIFKILNDADDLKPVNLFIVRQNSEFLFSFPYPVRGHRPFDVFHVPMANDTATEYKRFPTVSYGLEAVIPRTEFIPMLDEILKSEKQPTMVTIDIDATMSLQVEKHSLETNVSDQHIWFQWKNWSALKTATKMVDKCTIWQVGEPSQHIMFRFNLGSVGDLVFLKAAEVIFGKSKFRHLGTFCSLFPQHSSH